MNLNKLINRPLPHDPMANDFKWFTNLITQDALLFSNTKYEISRIFRHIVKKGGDVIYGAIFNVQPLLRTEIADGVLKMATYQWKRDRIT